MANKNWTYLQASHAMQAGVKFTQGLTPETFKSVRTGLNSCFVTDKAIADLLINKGIITQEEYIEQVRVAMIEEVERMEEELSERIGKDIKLGTLY